MKLSPVTIPLRAIEVLFTVGWVVVFAVFGLSSSLDTALMAVLTAVGIVVAVGGSLAYGWAYYQRFEYRLTEDTFDVDSGVFSRRSREVPYYRIQNVSIVKNILHRILGVAELRVETAGGDATEIRLRLVSEDEADRLQQEITERKRAEGDTPPTAEGDDDAALGRPMYDISQKELALLGVVSFDARLLILLVTLFAFADPATVSEVFVTVPAIALAPTALLVVYVAGAILSGIVAITNYYDFELRDLGDELRYNRGLLQQYSGSIPFTKVQSLTITENVLARQVGYARLLIETAGYSPNEQSGSRTAIPLAERHRVWQVAADIEDFERPEFTRPPKRARRRYVFRYLGILAILVAIAYALDATGTYEHAWYAIAGLIVLVPIAAHLKWQNLGYALQDEYIITRYGFWNRRITIVPYHRTQTLFQRQTIFQWRRNLATLRIDTAGTRALRGEDAVAVDIDADVASQLREQINDRLHEQLRERVAGFNWLKAPSESA